MSIALDLSFVVTFTIMFAVVQSVVTGDGSYQLNIYDKEVHMDVIFQQFLNNPPNYASVADAMLFIIILHYTCTGPFYWGIVCISVLYLFWSQGKNSPALLCVSASEMQDASKYKWIAIPLFLYFVTKSGCVAL